jgi:hypothetical protein
MKLTKAYLVALTLFAFNANAISTTTPSKISDGVALERMQAYAGSSFKSKKIGIVEPGTELLEYKSFLKTSPGLAMMEEIPWDKSVPFDRGAFVHIWEYLENGYSKVVINDVPYITKIARSLEECDSFPASPRYCWAKVIEEPEYYEWKQVALEKDGQKFWVLNRIIDGSGIISVKDEAVSRTRLIQTTYKEGSPEKAEEIKKEDEIIEEKKDNTALFQADMMDELELPSDPFQRAMVENMLKPKSEIAKEKKEEKAKKEQAVKEQKKAETMSQEEMFKQQKLNTNSQLNANIKNDSTSLTIQKVNKQDENPATKLELKANQPLNLTEDTM